jgi:hypothetical protein
VSVKTLRSRLYSVVDTDLERAGDEDRLFALASVLERIVGGFRPPPPRRDSRAIRTVGNSYVFGGTGEAVRAVCDVVAIGSRRHSIATV